MNKKRLRILAKFLRNVNRKHFNLETWCTVNGGTIEDGAIKDLGCGTTACAVGWAASIPSFRRDGFRLIALPVFGLARPTFDEHYDEAASALFFDLNARENAYLFMPFNYGRSDQKRPLAVVKRIERLLAGKPIPTSVMV
jgi:hypothetical protein